MPAVSARRGKRVRISPASASSVQPSRLRCVHRRQREPVRRSHCRAERHVGDQVQAGQFETADCHHHRSPVSGGLCQRVGRAQLGLIGSTQLAQQAGFDLRPGFGQAVARAIPAATCHIRPAWRRAASTASPPFFPAAEYWLPAPAQWRESARRRRHATARRCARLPPDACEPDFPRRTGQSADTGWRRSLAAACRHRRPVALACRRRSVIVAL